MSTLDKTKRPLSVALVITELEIGGAERCMTHLALRLDRMRFDPQLYVLASRPSPDKAALVEMLEANSVPVHFFDARSALHAGRTFRKLRDAFRDHRPQVVQTFLFHANVLGVLAARAAKVPRIMTGIRVADPSRWRASLERRVSRYADRIVCVSESVAAYAAESGFASEKIVVIPNGVDLSQFECQRTTDPLRPPIPAQHQVMTVIGRLHPQKGIDWLLNALPPFFRSHPNVDLAIVGRGPQEGELKTLAQRIGVADRVHFFGYRSDVPEILKASHLFLLPSRWEGMANALLEAMASGLPVIAARAEGVEELLGEESHGQIVPFGDESALLDGIASMFADPMRAKDLGAANRQRAARFSLERVVHNYESLWERPPECHF